MWIHFAGKSWLICELSVAILKTFIINTRTECPYKKIPETNFRYDLLYQQWFRDTQSVDSVVNISKREFCQSEYIYFKFISYANMNQYSKISPGCHVSSKPIIKLTIWPPFSHWARYLLSLINPFFIFTNFDLSSQYVNIRLRLAAFRVDI